MTTIVTSDLQVSEQRRDAYRWDFCEQILPRLIREHHATEVYLLGDCTEAKDHHSSKLVNRLCDAVYSWSQQADVVALEGNHDRKNAGSPFFQFLRHIPRVKWISQPTTLDGRLFLPHTRDQNYWDVQDGASFIFAHNIFQGVSLANGHQMGGIPLDVFPSGSTVISGDVHEPQDIDLDGVRLTYVGSPYLCDYGDNYEPRVLLIASNGKVKSLAVKGRNKRLVEWTSSEKNFHFLDTCNKGDIVKVRIDLQQKDIEEWPRIRDLIKDFAERDGVELDMIQPIVNYTQRKRDAATHTRKSNEDYLREYAARRGIAKNALQAGLDLIGG